MFSMRNVMRGLVLSVVCVSLCFAETLVHAQAGEGAKGAAGRKGKPTAPRRKKPKAPETVFVGGKSILTNGGFEDGRRDWKLAVGQELVADREAAHSGNACVTGEVTAPDRALQLIRTFPVRKGWLYRYEVWARATNGAKMTVFVVQPGRTLQEKENVGAFLDLPSQWRRYEGTFSPTADGNLDLVIVAPSSFGAPPGRIWVDDIAVYEFQITEPTLVSQGVGFNDEPSMARASDGSLYVAWNSFRDGADSLQVARFKTRGDGFERLATWPLLGGKGTYIFAPKIVAAASKVFLLYATEIKGNWDIYAVACTPAGPGRPLRITSNPGVDTDPDGAWRDGTLRVAWESNRNQFRQVFVASIKDGAEAEPVAQQVSADGIDSCDPSIAVSDDDQVCVAWHSFADNNYDIYMRRRPPSGTWESERRLTRAPTMDRHAVLFARGSELWIVYENAQMREYAVGATMDKRLVVARIGPDGLERPVSAGKPSPLWEGGEVPSPLFDESGRLWVAWARGNNKAWNVLLAGHNGRLWSDASPLTALKSMDRAPSLIIEGTRAIVAFQADDMPGSYPNEEASLKSKSDIYLVTRDLSKAEPAAAMAFEPLAERPDAFAAGELRVEYGEDAKTPNIAYKGQTLKLFYGDLHDHTDVSICNRIRDESIDEAYQDMRDITRDDFACVTDHGYNLTPYLWNYTAKMARTNNDPGRFLTFLAEEWTSSFEEYSKEHPFGFYGHRNLIFADPYFPRWWNERNYQTPAQVWEDLRKMKANFVHIPHQLADTGNVPVDWNFTDEVAQPVAEIFQARGSYEYKGAPREAKRTTPTKGYFLQDAWARGIVIGVIASPDHGGGMGKACVFAPELTREAILDALRERHCYGTTAAKIFLDVRVNGALMGERLPAAGGKPVEVKISVRCPGDIDRVEVCRNNEFIYTKEIAGRVADLTFVDEKPLDDFSYYYIRIIQKDGEIAWSSPVWLGAK